MSKSPIDPLVAQIMETNMRQTQAVTNQVIDSLVRDLTYERARNAAIVAKVTKLMHGQHMPTSAAVLAALHPSDEEIDNHREATVW